jgi:hypothetical protein
MLSPLELLDIATATGRAPSEFCEFIRAPDYVQANHAFHEVFFNIFVLHLFIFFGGRFFSSFNFLICFLITLLFDIYVTKIYNIR